MKRKKTNLSFTCSVCGQDIEPLVRFDGTMWCPKCKQDLFKQIEVSTKDPDGHFALSQEFFARYLLEDDEKSRQYLDNAIAFCRKAAYNGNAYALLNLGYYYSVGYDDSVQPETGRVFAHKCYDLAKKAGIPEVTSRIDRRKETDIATQVAAQQATGIAYIRSLAARIQTAGVRGGRVPRIGLFYIGQVDSGEELIGALKELAKVCGDEKKQTLYMCDDSGSMKRVNLSSLNAKNYQQCCNRYWGYRNLHIVHIKSKQKGVIRKEIDSKEINSNNKKKKQDEMEQCLSVVCSTLKKHNAKAVDFFDDDIIISIYEYERSGRDANTNSALDKLHQKFKDVMEGN